MFEALGAALWLITDPMVWLAIVTGTALGIVIGAIPGLGSIIGITICLPFTFVMGQMPAIALLLSVYCGSIYGGSIAAILINAPGTPQSAATVLDGFSMTKLGKPGHALGWATAASVFGGLFSCVVLILLAPQLAAFALNFGPVEVFALICLALTCIATISRGSMIKGLLAGAIGLWCGAVGSDPISGDLRFTFGYFPLSAGFDLVSMVVGLFALSEVFSRIAGERAEAGAVPAFSRMTLPSLGEWKGRLGVLLKSSVIGSVIGVLPGTGAATAAFISYAEAKRTSPRGDGFGKGEPDGIIAAESANNAVTGGALVPTLALGIPGDAVTAIMLSTLIIQGITPGVRLMVENPDIVYASFIVLIIINIAMLLIALATIRAIAFALKAPEAIIFTLVVFFCVVGSYGVRSSMFDVMTMVAAGIVGFLFRYFHVPIAPMVIGLVLGSQMELSLRQALVITDGDATLFLTAHPIALVLFIVTALLLAKPILLGLRRPRENTA
ncbi:tripartite tricarboxylate transporter permease [Nitratireductor indicus]|uniref:tripartite tricarboxylate transporter permease n=1 Tax=Nitratireductor indicus TaxID=721133 RepID=UPI0028756F33|nr:tripartite tricarboxylate transporter permease [Nitratireductor indicus]MDS1138068.1 tripartite tricarboxylate transporter permease [Nitratireductor indicus]